MATHLAGRRRLCGAAGVFILQARHCGISRRRRHLRLCGRDISWRLAVSGRKYGGRSIRRRKVANAKPAGWKRLRSALFRGLACLGEIASIVATRRRQHPKVLRAWRIAPRLGGRQRGGLYRNTVFGIWKRRFIARGGVRIFQRGGILAAAAAGPSALHQAAGLLGIRKARSYRIALLARAAATSAVKNVRAHGDMPRRLSPAPHGPPARYRRASPSATLSHWCLLRRYIGKLYQHPAAREEQRAC